MNLAKSMSFEDIIDDIKHNKKISSLPTRKDKYSELKLAAKRFIDMYESAFGAPDLECSDFWDLKKLIK